MSTQAGRLYDLDVPRHTLVTTYTNQKLGYTTGEKRIVPTASGAVSISIRIRSSLRGGSFSWLEGSGTFTTTSSTPFAAFGYRKGVVILDP